MWYCEGSTIVAPQKRANYLDNGGAANNEKEVKRWVTKPRTKTSLFRKRNNICQPGRRDKRHSNNAAINENGECWAHAMAWWLRQRPAPSASSVLTITMVTSMNCSACWRANLAAWSAAMRNSPYSIPRALLRITTTSTCSYYSWSSARGGGCALEGLQREEVGGEW